MRFEVNARILVFDVTAATVAIDITTCADCSGGSPSIADFTPRTIASDG